MAILKTRYERGTDPTFRANAFVRGGRLVRIAAEGDHPHKPKVEEVTAPTDYSVGAAAADAGAGQDVAVTHRGWMLLQSSAPIGPNVDVSASTQGRIQASAGGAGERVFGRSLSRATAADQLVWVKPYL